MFDTEKFIKYCSQTLESYLGHISNDIINKIRTKKNLDGNSTDVDIKRFINLIEANISVFSGKHRAVEICDIIRAKVPEFVSVPKKITKVEEFAHATQISDIDKEEVATPQISDIEKEDAVHVTQISDIEKEDAAHVTQTSGVTISFGAEDIEKEDVAPPQISYIEKEEVAKTYIEKEDITKRDTTRTADEIREIWKMTNEYIENKILTLLEIGLTIDNILKKLNIEEEDLADRIIDLDTKEFVILEDKNWTLTEKGKDALKLIRKKLKSDYLRGIINKEEFLKKLEYLTEQTIKKDDTGGIKEEPDEIAEEPAKVQEEIAEEPAKVQEEMAEEPANAGDDKKIICKKCGTKNKKTDIFCTKCGEYIKELR